MSPISSSALRYLNPFAPELSLARRVLSGITALALTALTLGVAYVIIKALTSRNISPLKPGSTTTGTVNKVEAARAQEMPTMEGAIQNCIRKNISIDELKGCYTEKQRSEVGGVNLSGLHISELQFDALARVFPDITCFTFKNTALTKAQIEKLSQFSKLHTLDLTCDKDKDPWLTDALIVFLPATTSRLIIRGQKLVTGSTFETLSAKTMQLAASDCSLINEAIKKLKEHKSLIILEIQNNEKITQVNGLLYLKILRASNTSITDEGVSQLPACLEHLSLDGCAKLTKRVLTVLPPNLKSKSLPEGI